MMHLRAATRCCYFILLLLLGNAFGEIHNVSWTVQSLESINNVICIGNNDQIHLLCSAGSTDEFTKAIAEENYAICNPDCNDGGTIASCEGRDYIVVAVANPVVFQHLKCGNPAVLENNVSFIFSTDATKCMMGLKIKIITGNSDNAECIHPSSSTSTTSHTGSGSITGNSPGNSGSNPGNSGNNSGNSGNNMGSSTSASQHSAGTRDSAITSPSTEGVSDGNVGVLFGLGVGALVGIGVLLVLVVVGICTVLIVALVCVVKSKGKSQTADLTDKKEEQTAIILCTDGGEKKDFTDSYNSKGEPQEVNSVSFPVSSPKWPPPQAPTTSTQYNSKPNTTTKTKTKTNGGSDSIVGYKNGQDQVSVTSKRTAPPPPTRSLGGKPLPPVSSSRVAPSPPVKPSVTQSVNKFNKPSPQYNSSHLRSV